MEWKRDSFGILHTGYLLSIIKIKKGDRETDREREREEREREREKNSTKKIDKNSTQKCDLM